MQSSSSVVVSILCPTAGCPETAADFTRSVEETSGLNDVEVLFYIADDDEKAPEYIDALQPWSGSRVHIYIGPNVPRTKSYNFLAGKAAGEFLQVAHHDMVYLTPGWQHILRGRVRSVSDGIHCTWFNDGLLRASQCTAPIISQVWLKTLGYLTPGLDDFDADAEWIADLGAKVQRLHYIDSVHIENRVGETSSNMNREMQRSRDEEILRRTDSLREHLAKKLLAVVEEHRSGNFIPLTIPDWHVHQQAKIRAEHLSDSAES